VTTFGSIARLAWRESRTARRRLLLYMSSISLGVAALVAIDSFASNVQTSIRENSRSILGGDVAFSSNAKFPEPLDKAIDSLAALGMPVARVVTFGSMALAPRSGGTRLVQVKGISDNWPLYGTVETQPAGVWPQLLQGSYCVVDPGLLISLDAKVGDTLNVGYAKFVILATVTSVPGDPGVAAAIGPRIYVPSRFLPETQLLGFGSRAAYDVMVKLPPSTVSAKWVAPLRPRFQKENIRVVTVTQREQSLTQDIGRLADFLGIVGLVALLLGGIGVASGVNAFVTRKIDTVAVLRCLGATSSQVLAIYVLQAAAMGFLGAAFGVVLGIAIQFLLPLAIKDFLPVDVRVTLDPRAIGMGLAIGVWVALVFALRPLLVVRRVSPLQALRRDAEALEKQRLRDVPSHLVNLGLLGSVLLLAVQRADSFARGVMFAAGIGGSMLVLWISATTLSWLARRIVTARFPYVIRQGVANLYRPANQTRSVVLALGFGSFLVSTLYIVQANLLRQFDVTAERSRANLVLFDIQEDQREGVDSILRAAGQTALGYAPIITMKISAINGRAPAQWAASHGLDERHWTLRREYRSTYRDTVVPTEKITSGQWFGHAKLADTLSEVSLEQDLASQLRVRLGDIITWDVQGVQLSAKLTSLREVNWGRFEPNFFAVFSPGAISKAPKQYATVAAVSLDTTIARIQRQTVTKYPNVSSLDLSLVRRTVAQIVEKVAMAVRFLTLFSVAMGIPVLFSAVAATRRERLREGVLLKVLGATRAQIGRILLAEYLLLGALGALAGMVLSFGGAWALVHFVFDATFQPALLPAFLIALTMMALAVGIGFLTGRDVFRETPMAALREA